MRQVRRSSAGSSPTRVVEITRETHRGFRIAAISASTFSLGLAGLAPPEAGCQLGQLAAGLGQGLVEAADCLSCRFSEWVTTMRRSAPKTTLLGLEGAEPREALLVHGPVAGLRHGEQVGVVRRWQRADEVQRRVLDQLEVVRRVLAGVEDEVSSAASRRPAGPRNGGRARRRCGGTG